MKHKLVYIFLFALLLSLFGCSNETEEICKPVDSIYETIESIRGEESIETFETTSTEVETEIVTEYADGKLTVHFIDVKQGDCTLLQSDGKNILIDVGGIGKGTYIQYYLKKQGVDKLDLLILTHPDADHIDSADVIITKFDIGEVWMPDYEKDTKTYEEVENALFYKNLSSRQPYVGETFEFGSSILTVLGPVEDSSNANNESIVCRVECAGYSIMLAGDAEIDEEKDIVYTGLELDSDILKMSHHGSYTGMQEDFIKAVSPSSAVISVGDNSYGHPHREALQWAKDNGILLYRTDELGNIVCSISVDGIVFNSSPSEIEIIPEETYDFKCEEGTYSWILNTRSKKIHYPSCSGVKTMSEKNKSQSDDSVENLIAEGYSTCGTCFK